MIGDFKMSHLDYTTKNTKGKHLNYEKRIKIETLSKTGMKSEKIALEIGCSGRTVRRELAKGKTELLNTDLSKRYEYSADIGQQKHDYAATAKGASLKIGKDYALVEYIENAIIEKKMGSRKFRETFKTITCDNGCENLDFEGIQRSALTNIERTKVYYAHPYSSWERGSNENANKLIRRFIPKGTDIGKCSCKQIQMIEHWINNYPRRILNGQSSNMVLEKMLRNR